MNLAQVPDLGTRQLQAVLAVAEYGSFVAAASYLRMSQPALSRIVKRVEDVLGIALFDRTTRSVQLTSAGREFLAVAERILNDLKISSQNLRDLIGEQRGQVILASIMSIASCRLPDILATYRQSRAAVEIHLREGVHGAVLEEVRSGAADFGLTYIEDLPDGLDAEQLGQEAFCVALPRGHPLSEQETVSLAELSNEPLISLPFNAQTRRIIDGIAAAEGFSLHHAVTVTQSPTMMRLVAAGVGPALVPAGATFGMDDERIVVRSIREPQIERRFGIVTLQGRSLTPAAAGLVNVVRESWIIQDIRI
jgi:DNA-binding transcriptional LysR family regulator